MTTIVIIHRMTIYECNISSLKFKEGQYNDPLAHYCGHHMCGKISYTPYTCSFLFGIDFEASPKKLFPKHQRLNNLSYD